MHDDLNELTELTLNFNQVRVQMKLEQTSCYSFMKPNMQEIRAKIKGAHKTLREGWKWINKGKTYQI